MTVLPGSRDVAMRYDFAFGSATTLSISYRSIEIDLRWT
jgi:hypothetical protein